MLGTLDPSKPSSLNCNPGTQTNARGLLVCMGEAYYEGAAEPWIRPIHLYGIRIEGPRNRKRVS